MKRKLILATILCLFLQSGCYVSTNLKVKNRQLPADFSAPVLVITLQEKTNLGQQYLTLLEQGILQALTEKGINSVTLNQAVDKSEQDRTTELLLQNDYRALLKIVMTLGDLDLKFCQTRSPLRLIASRKIATPLFIHPVPLIGGRRNLGPRVATKR